jgi:hypothetical protein
MPKEVTEYLYAEVFNIVRLRFTADILMVNCFTPSKWMRQLVLTHLN